MPKIETVLHPTDFSENSKKAASHACFLARHFKADLHLLYVLEDAMGKIPAPDVGFPPPGDRAECDEITRGLNDVIGVDLEGLGRLFLATQLGPISNKIVSYAVDNEVDVIVMGTHGRSGIAHALVGSVAESVVRNAQCPVLTVRA